MTVNLGCGMRPGQRNLGGGTVFPCPCLTGLSLSSVDPGGLRAGSGLCWAYRSPRHGRCCHEWGLPRSRRVGAAGPRAGVPRPWQSLWAVLVTAQLSVKMKSRLWERRDQGNPGERDEICEPHSASITTPGPVSLAVPRPPATLLHCLVPSRGELHSTWDSGLQMRKPRLGRGWYLALSL